MKALRTTLFVVAFVILGSQTFRHAYVRWLEPRTSVLDRYDTATAQKISRARSLDELAALYEAAFKRLEAEKAAAKAQPPKEESTHEPTEAEKEAEKNERDLRAAIQDWESKTREIRELWNFWIIGVLAFAAGLLVTRRYEPWLGMALLILAFAEMIYATCPVFRMMGNPEFDRLFLQKFLLSAISLALLVGYWNWSVRLDQRRV